MYRSIVRAAVTGFLVVAGSNLVLADDLTAQNDAARAVYGKGRAALLAAADPVIVVAFDDLILHHNKQRISAGFTPPLYHRLKELAHLPLGIFGALVPIATGAVADSNWREDLAMLEAAAVAAQDEVDAIAATPAIKATAKKLLEASLAFIRLHRMANATPDWATLASFSASVAPWILAMTTESANAQIDGLHALVQRWKAELGAEAWAKLHVLVLGPKTPRVDHLAYQYFVAALGQGSAETRVIYTESVYDENAALALLGVLLIDRQVGAAFFGESGRMERDLLGDAARVKLLQLFGKLGAN